MKCNINRGKIALLLLMAIFFLASPVFSQEQIPLGSLTRAMDRFTGSLAESLPFNASLGLNWADAHIGNFFPSFPPHFGVGFSFGYTTLDSGAFRDLLGQFSLSLPQWTDGFGGFPLLGYAIEVRFGGFFLPFDMGFKFGYNPQNLNFVDRMNYLLIGGDVRYAILEEKVLWPAVSVGVGFNHLSGGVETKIGEEIRYGYIPTDDSAFITVETPKVGIDWAVSAIDFKVQASKSLFFITPYLGFGISRGWARAGYQVKSAITDSGGNLNTASDYFEQFGIDNLNQNGFSSEARRGGWNYRTYGGLSFNLAVLRLDLTGLYSFVDKNYGITLGFRVQI